MDDNESKVRWLHESPPCAHFAATVQRTDQALRVAEALWEHERKHAPGTPPWAEIDGGSRSIFMETAKVAIAAMAGELQPLVVGGDEPGQAVEGRHVRWHLAADVEWHEYVVRLQGAHPIENRTFYTGPQPAVADSVAEAMVERVEQLVGMGHNAWDHVAPLELIRAVFRAAAEGRTNG